MSPRLLPLFLGGCLTIACTAPSSDSSVSPVVDVVPSTGDTGADGRRSVVWISFDTTRADRLSLYDHARSTTPELRRWASSAVVFDQAHSHAPWTKPSMTTTFSSTLPDVHGVTQWDHALSPDQPTVALQLHAEGYATQAFVTHVAMVPETNSFHLGFDVFDLSSWRGIGSPGDIETSTEATDDATLALAQLQATGEPYLLWVHYVDPHSDYLDHEGWDYGDTESDRYDEEIAHTDHQLARLLQLIDGLPEPPIVVLHADHGEAFGEHGRWEHTNSLYEELMRVPLVVRIPDCPPGRVSANVGLIDLAPTVLEAAGASVPAPFAGTSWLGDDGCLEVTTDRTVLMETRRSANLRGSFDGRYKVVRDEESGAVEIYDVVADPAEQDDLAGLDPAFDAERLQAVEERYGPWTPPDP